METVHGRAWRCLRCGDFVIGEPKGSGPADEAPIVPRGKALRDLLILRVLAVERIGRGVVIAFIAWAVWKFGSNQNAVRQLFESDLTAFKPLANHFGWDVEHAGVVERIRKAFDYKPKTVHVVAGLLAGYALLETVEGVGLWMSKRWGEYLTAVGTSIFLPLEVWDGLNKIHEHKSWIFAACTFAINVGAVVYLLVSKRLFGIRGGGEAFEAAKHADALLTVEIAACGGPKPHAREAAGEIALEKAAQQSREPQPQAQSQPQSQAATVLLPREPQAQAATVLLPQEPRSESATVQLSREPQPEEAAGGA
ncbi:hypothetical protein GCM10009839_84300 [Catenulispora yoronensis]|uniref:DUF2127 domain-containing protein n=1 Tax=Catenulispora yoronensis TaxID=450799 RepID=A0ABN2VEQ5_9ACTN